MMNVKEIKELIALMNENNLTELEIEREGLRVKLKKLPEGGLEQRIEAIPVNYPSAQAAPHEAAKPHTEAQPAKKYLEIKTPMVGTFYEAPSPDSLPYIEVGSEIVLGQVLCIIEAMKLMNEIKSEVKGRVVERLVENAQPVEFGQVLFLVEPA
ncbi:MAG: acetyl-CoA carboxylase biotin carboxyl carrier protein [Candidatus Omnitrophica bacterium]|nr:acetyl-CoA carboxylase biotin carboxyl carrier protein [Candidatus Omnitrophota bacterium]